MELEEFDEVRKWLNNVKGGSKPVYKSGLRLFCEWTKLNPAQLLDEAEEDRKKSRRERGKPEERLMEFYHYLIEEKKAAKKSATLYFTAVRSFYKWNGFPLTVKTPKAAPKKENRKAAITPEIVRKLVDHAPTLRDRAIILFMFQGGFDVSTICSLNYGDVAEELENNRIPMLLRVVREKEEVEYFTFVGRDSVEALKAYLNDRRAKGEEIKHNSPLFIKDKAKRRKAERINPYHIQNMLRDVAVRAGLVKKDEMENADFNPYRPHALRSGFSTVLRLNGFDPLLVEFMQGHTIPYNGAYLIPPVEKVRQMYAEVEPQLSISAVRDIGEFEKKVDEKLKAYKEIVDDLVREKEVMRSLIEKLSRENAEIREKYRKMSAELNKFKTQFGEQMEWIKEMMMSTKPVTREDLEKAKERIKKLRKK